MVKALYNHDQVTNKSVGQKFHPRKKQKRVRGKTKIFSRWKFQAKCYIMLLVGCLTYWEVLLLDIHTLVLVGLLQNQVKWIANILPHFLSFVDLPNHPWPIVFLCIRYPRITIGSKKKNSLCNCYVCQFSLLVVVNERDANVSDGQRCLKEGEGVGILSFDSVYHSSIRCKDQHSLKSINKRFPVPSEQKMNSLK